MESPLGGGGWSANYTVDPNSARVERQFPSDVGQGQRKRWYRSPRTEDLVAVRNHHRPRGRRRRQEDMLFRVPDSDLLLLQTELVAFRPH